MSAINASEVETLRAVIADLKAELKRQKAGREIEQTMIRNALPKLVALDRVRALCDDAEDRRAFIAAHELRAALEGKP